MQFIQEFDDDDDENEITTHTVEPNTIQQVIFMLF